MTTVIQTVLYLFGPLAITTTLAAIVLRPVIVAVLRARKHRNPKPTIKTATRHRLANRKTTKAQKAATKHRMKDPIEAVWATGIYQPTPLSNELTDAIGVLLVITGRLGVSTIDLANQLNNLNPQHCTRPVARIKTIIDDIAHTGIENDYSATAWTIELSQRLHQTNHNKNR